MPLSDSSSFGLFRFIGEALCQYKIICQLCRIIIGLGVGSPLVGMKSYIRCRALLSALASRGVSREVPASLRSTLVASWAFYSGVREEISGTDTNLW